MEDVLLSPTDFVALVNQTLEFAYPRVLVEGEISNFRVSKNRWVYFDIKDEMSSVKCFATVYQLPGPLEDGMLVRVTGQPRLHNLFGFSLNVQTILPAGEGTIKKAAALLEEKLKAEGLFDAERKRSLPYPPQRIGLIASSESAAYSDFLKVLDQRWSGLEILLRDVQVQGQQAPSEIVEAIQQFNAHADESADVLVITRGGGSADDLAAFSTEQVTRAVAASRIPTLVAIGHERDVSLAELAADLRASTPSNAAELLVPDRREVLAWMAGAKESLAQSTSGIVQQATEVLEEQRAFLRQQVHETLDKASIELETSRKLLRAYNPHEALKRGYAIIRRDTEIIKSVSNLRVGDEVRLNLKDGEAGATIKDIRKGA